MATTAATPSSPASAAATPRWIVPFVAAVTAMLTLQMSNLGFSPLLPLIQKEFTLSFSQLGLFTGLYGLLAIAWSVPAGLIAKRFGEKRALVVGLVGVAVGLMWLSRAAGFGEALAARTLWISGYRFAFVCVLTAIAITCPPRLKGRSMGVVGAASSLASVIGAPLGGALAERFGWRVGIGMYAAAALVGAITILAFYRSRATPADVVTSPHGIGHADPTKSAAASAFRSPIVWVLAALIGLGGMGQFSVTFFVPSAARSMYALDAAQAGWVISTGYLCAMFANLGIGALVDRYDRWTVMAWLFAVLTVASASMTIDNLLVFRIATATVLAGGFSAANQIYGIAGDVMRGREAGNAIGVVSLGAGVFGYIGPQLLGSLRDWTGGFTAGWMMVATADALTLLLLLALRRRVLLARD